MLNLAKVSQQIAHMAAESQRASEHMGKRLEKALQQLRLESGRLANFLRS